MQILKEETEKNILEAARNEFSKHGYKDASLRRIAAEAGMSVGNLYRYFRDKQDLFSSIVEPAYDQMIYVIEHHEDEFHEQGLSLGEAIEVQIQHIAELFSSYRQELLILLHGSAGTRFERARDEMIQLLSSGVMHHLLQHKTEFDSGALQTVSISIATAFLEGMFQLIYLNRHRRKFEREAKFYLDLFMSGFEKYI
jgi:AcrR family transcriptional regulator